ncbi:response regulator receiver [Sulfurifustis variabilis]|uniref:Response regulator receiver n=1 Tax=Sulfurifustis variabilis TaxID=1675686 RepID=A0A1B4V723_9GAMM|nr:response regulator [Sulfurifustis variabilis]BAU48392.1 response regulator receiver [Sulfurifustis variabilis]
MTQKHAQSAVRILLVDDDRLVLATLAEGLRARGYPVDAVDNGREALEIYRREPPSIVILDVRMPGMSGLDTAKAMLAAGHRPIIMLSAYDDQPIVHEAIALGVSGYLVKPIEVNQLVPSIEATLARFAEVNALMRDTTNLRDGVEHNRIVSTAVGILMEREGLGQDESFERLRGHARAQRRPLREVAREFVEALAAVNTISRSSAGPPG